MPQGRRETLPNGRPWPQHMQEKHAKWKAKQEAGEAERATKSPEVLLARLNALEQRLEALERRPGGQS